MKLTLLMYRRLAVFLWGFVFAVVGWSYAYYFQWGQRKAIFSAVLAVGVYALFMLQKVNVERQEAMVLAQKTRGKEGGINSRVVENSQEVLTERGWSDKKVPREGTEEEGNKLIREKLDEFLIMQQDR